MSTEWYVACSGERNGPFSSTELKSMARDGRITHADHVWKEGLSDWVGAASVTGLFSGPPPVPVATSNELDFSNIPSFASGPLAPSHTESTLHPEVQRFLDRCDTIQLKQEFDYFYEYDRVSGTSLGGGSPYDLGMKLLGIAILCFLAGGFFGEILFAIGAILFFVSIGVMALALILPHKESYGVRTFEIVFNGNRKSWRSNDERFWQPVRKFFKA